MMYIRDNEGNIIHKSKNLQGIRKYVSKNIIKIVCIDRLKYGYGKLMILFENKNSFECTFIDFTVLIYTIMKWKNLYGSKLTSNYFPEKNKEIIISYKGIK